MMSDLAYCCGNKTPDAAHLVEEGGLRGTQFGKGVRMVGADANEAACETGSQRQGGSSLPFLTNHFHGN